MKAISVVVSCKVKRSGSYQSAEVGMDMTVLLELDKEGKQESPQEAFRRAMNLLSPLVQDAADQDLQAAMNYASGDPTA